MKLIQYSKIKFHFGGNVKESLSGKLEENVRNDNHTKILRDFKNQRRNQDNRNLNSKEK